uniref:THAP-type domain-containing protein n=1 Tax=Sparus aurata TaxID=8175 RepID=A0A671UHG4_SPAAU
MQIRRQHENVRAAFSDFSTLRPVFKKVRFQALRFQDPYGRSAKTMQYMCVFAKRRCRLDGASSRYSFHRLPRDEELRRMWLKQLNLKKPPKTLYVCSFHSVDKKPTEEHPHPTLWLGNERPPEKRRRVLKRTDSSVTRITGMISCELCAAAKSSCDAQTQWSDPGMEDHTYSKGATITCELHTPLPPELDADSLLYTGIPLTEFITLVACLQTLAPASPSMPVVDQILMTLMKLRQNFVMADLARRFKISQGQVSKTVGMWVDIMCEHMKDLIVWLPRETIKATLPKAFKEHFANTTCVIDCTETVLQKPKNLDSRSESYSHYYANNTVKYLVAVSPSGVIMFISDAYGGKCSDRYIMQNCGFLDYLRAGDEVMGDRGFTVRDLLEERRVNLIIPTFTRKGCQLTNEGVTRICRIAHARIHVELAIRRLKVAKILSQTVPINLVRKIDKILKICLRSELISSEH